jgi:hypothetical protein
MKRRASKSRKSSKRVPGHQATRIDVSALSTTHTTPSHHIDPITEPVVAHDDENDDDSEGVQLFSSTAPSRTKRVRLQQPDANVVGDEEVAANKDEEDAIITKQSGNFADLGLSPWLLQSLASLHMLSPTPIQMACVPAALSGRDIIGCAEV